MALTSNSPYEGYSSISMFPAHGVVDTFYLDESSQSSTEITENTASTGIIYIWDGSVYVFYCNLADTSFVGPRPAHAPHHNH